MTKETASSQPHTYIHVYIAKVRSQQYLSELVGVSRHEGNRLGLQPLALAHAPHGTVRGTATLANLLLSSVDCVRQQYNSTVETDGKERNHHVVGTYILLSVYIYIYIYIYVGMVITYSKRRINRVRLPARGQLNREDAYFPVPIRT